MRYCTRIMINVDYLGQDCYDHNATDSHDWLDSGVFCCWTSPEWKQQKCWCKAERWVETTS